PSSIFFETPSLDQRLHEPRQVSLYFAGFISEFPSLKCATVHDYRATSSISVLFTDQVFLLFHCTSWYSPTPSMCATAQVFGCPKEHQL
ncbi:MAG: hypothetical protein V2I33_16505, partial [Kangiellaceae bacterium]|nr:hypothetical protein [Kangiellaceae bacterium]